MALSGFVDGVAVAGGLAAVAAVVVPLGGWIRDRFRRGLGSRRMLVRKLDKLCCGVRTQYVDDLFGVPTFEHRRGDHTERIYVTPHAYIQTLADADGSITLWAVTVTDRRFRPRFTLPSMSSDGSRWAVELTQTRFAGLDHLPNTFSWSLGARRFHYTESHWFGNPGGYQTYVTGYNDAGAGEFDFHDFTTMPPTSDGLLKDDGAYMDVERAAHVIATTPGLEEFRRRTTINTFGIIGPRAGLAGTDVGWFGADEDEVRLLGYVETTLARARPSRWWKVPLWRSGVPSTGRRGLPRRTKP